MEMGNFEISQFPPCCGEVRSGPDQKIYSSKNRWGKALLSQGSLDQLSFRQKQFLKPMEILLSHTSWKRASPPSMSETLARSASRQTVLGMSMSYVFFTLFLFRGRQETDARDICWLHHSVSCCIYFITQHPARNLALDCRLLGSTMSKSWRIGCGRLMNSS